MPAQRNASAVRRIAHRVTHQVAEGAGELVAAADDLRGVVYIERDLMPASRERFRVGRDLEQQWNDREFALVQHAMLAFERRQRQEIVDQALHIPRLLGHE